VGFEQHDRRVKRLREVCAKSGALVFGPSRLATSARASSARSAGGSVRASAQSMFKRPAPMDPPHAKPLGMIVYAGSASKSVEDVTARLTISPSHPHGFPADRRPRRLTRRGEVAILPPSWNDVCLPFGSDARPVGERTHGFGSRTKRHWM